MNLPPALVADGLLVVHGLFVLWVVLGCVAVCIWPQRTWLWWLHGAALSWGVWISASGGVCPLTPWEDHFRLLAGRDAYQGSGFIDHHVRQWLYPQGLTRIHQVLMAAGLVLVNAVLYAWAWGRRRHGAA
jgi:hypothetical protein